MVFINRSVATIARPDSTNKIVKGKEFWTFSRAREAMANANKETNRIIHSAVSAYEEQKKRGYSDGIEFAKIEQSQNMIAIVSQTVDYFSRVESQMVELVVDAIRRIINDFSDREKIMAVVRSSLTLMRNQRHITVTVNPAQSNVIVEDISRLKTIFPSIDHIEVTSNPSLDLDACVIESDIGRVEASMTSQIEALRSSFTKVFGMSAEFDSAEKDTQMADQSIQIR